MSFLVDAIPKPIRFGLSGGIGNYLFIKLDAALLDMFGSVPVAFCLAYIFSILWQYILHAFLVFRCRLTFTGLISCYAAYASSIVLSFVLSAAVDYLLGTGSHTLKWFITMGILSVFNYFVVSAALEPPVPTKSRLA